MRCKAALLFLFLLFLSPVAFAQSAELTREEARSQLRQKQLDFNKDAFIKSVNAGDLDTVRLFLKAGMSPDVRFRDGDTALMIAAGCGRAEIVEALLNGGAKLEAKDQGGHTALLVAFFGAMAAEVPAEALQSFVGDEKESALCPNMSAGGHVQVIRLLIARGANVNIRATDQGETPLAIAATYGAVELARLLLAQDVDVNQESWDDYTVLQWLKNIDAALSEPQAKEDQALFEWLQATAPGRAEVERLLRLAGAKR